MVSDDQNEEWGYEEEFIDVCRTISKVAPVMADASPDLGSERFEPLVVDMLIVDPNLVPRRVGLLEARKLQQVLKHSKFSVWTIRVWIAPVDAIKFDGIYVWLKIDQWRVSECLGWRQSETFDNLDDFVSATWGATK